MMVSVYNGFVLVKIKNTIKLIIFLAIVFCAQTTWANTDSVDNKTLRNSIDSNTSINALLNLSLAELGKISIATRTSRSSSEIPSTVFVYTQDDIRSHGWTSLSELVVDIPGVDVVNKSGRATTLSVRGVADLNFQGAKTVVMIDGHNMAFSALGSPGFSGIMSQYDIFSAKRIEVQIGPGGTLHGANAFGIVINIITMAPEDIDGVEIDLIGGSQSKVIPSIRFGKRNGPWGIFQSFTAWKQSDATLSEVAISKNPDDSLVIYNNETFEAQTTNNYDLHGYADYDGKLRLGYRYSKVDSGRGSSLVSTKKGSLMVNQSMLYLDFKSVLTTKLHYALISHYKASKIDKDGNYFVDTVRNRVGVSLTESNSLVIDNQFTYFQNKKFTWVGGLFIEKTRQRPSAIAIAPNTLDPNEKKIPTLNDERDFDNTAGYLQLEWIPNNDFYFVTGVRYVKSESKYASEIIPRFGVRYILTDKWLTKFNYQKGYRPPGVSEGLQRGVVAGNSDISSELIDSFELSLIGKPMVRTGVRATLFHSDITNIIARVPYAGTDPSLISTDDNIGKIKVHGAELEINYEVSNLFEIQSTATYTYSINEDNDQKNRTIVPYKLNFSLIMNPAQQWTIVWDNYLRLRPRTDTANALYGGKNAPNWLLSNLTVVNERAFKMKNLNLTLSIRNLFNQKYGHVDPRATTNPSTPFLTSYHPQETINALLGVNYRF